MTAPVLDRPPVRCWCPECQPTDPAPVAAGAPATGAGTTCPASLPGGSGDVGQVYVPQAWRC